MRNLEKRLAALELQTTPPEPLTIIRRLVAPGKPQTEIECLRDVNGNEWKRQPGDTEQSLIDRASQHCARNAGGVASLVGFG
jgi:hypothetical protein